MIAFDSDDPVTVYLRELASVPPLTKEEEAHLFRESAQTGEQAEIAKRRLLESRLPLVLPIAERYASRGLSVPDLIQEGNLGLMRALENFPKSGLDDFSEYASSCIEDAMSGAVAKLDRSHASPSGRLLIPFITSVRRLFPSRRDRRRSVGRIVGFSHI